MNSFWKGQSTTNPNAWSDHRIQLCPNLNARGNHKIQSVVSTEFSGCIEIWKRWRSQSKRLPNACISIASLFSKPLLHEMAELNLCIGVFSIIFNFMIKTIAGIFPMHWHHITLSMARAFESADLRNTADARKGSCALTCRHKSWMWMSPSSICERVGRFFEYGLLHSVHRFNSKLSVCPKENPEAWCHLEPKKRLAKAFEGHVMQQIGHLSEALYTVVLVLQHYHCVLEPQISFNTINTTTTCSLLYMLSQCWLSSWSHASEFPAHNLLSITFSHILQNAQHSLP